MYSASNEKIKKFDRFKQIKDLLLQYEAYYEHPLIDIDNNTLDQATELFGLTHREENRCKIIQLPGNRVIIIRSGSERVYRIDGDYYSESDRSSIVTINPEGVISLYSITSNLYDQSRPKVAVEKVADDMDGDFRVKIQEYGWRPDLNIDLIMQAWNAPDSEISV